jgi:hypothetical protein
MTRISNDVLCPRCGGPVFHFGKDPASGLQRHRCKDSTCYRQSVPGRPTRARKYPRIICPKCGSKMGIFKQLSDTLRFRCNHYRNQWSKRCTHKINIPLPGKDSFKLVVDTKEIRLIQGKVRTTFHWNKMDFSTSTVALALYFSFFRAMPAPSEVLKATWAW